MGKATHQDLCLYVVSLPWKQLLSSGTSKGGLFWDFGAKQREKSSD